MRYNCIRLMPLLILPLLLFACKKGEKDAGADMADMQMPVDVAKAEVQPVMLYKEYPGTLKAVNQVDIVARVNGYLKTINYNYGDIVEKGQILFTIEDTQYRNAVEEAQATLANAKSSLEYYAKQYEAMQEAIKKDAVSRMELSQAKSNYEEGLASIRNAEAELETAKTNLSYCVVRAPFRGRISAPTLSAGAYVGGAGSPVTLATIYDVSEFYADFAIEDGSLLQLQTNRSNSIKLDNSSLKISFNEELKHPYEGKISYLAPEIDTSTGMIKIRARILNPYNELRDGMYAKIQLPIQYETQAVLVKDIAIGTDQLGKYVYLVNDSNKVVYTPIKIGEIVNDSMRVVTSGLKGGDLYVTKALLKVRNGKTVKPVLIP